MARINLVELAQQRAQQHIQQDEIVIDATTGNGYDTLMLAEVVGEQGKVFAFDVQQVALRETEKRLKDAGVLERVKLIEESHAEMFFFIPEAYRANIKLVMFNLGYLPGGDKQIMTQSGETVGALNVALSMLSDDGALSVVAYPGHVGGDSECDLVSRWCDGLDTKQYRLEKVIPETVKRKPPQWFWIKKI